MVVHFCVCAWPRALTPRPARRVQLMNIADHYTRSIAQFRVQRAIGVLMGTQTGRDVQVRALSSRRNSDSLSRALTRARRDADL